MRHQKVIYPRWLVSLLIFPLIVISISGCEEDPDVINPEDVGIWKYYSASGGLSNNDIRTIKQDEKGFIWVGTYGGGVCKYDDGNWSFIKEKNGLLDDRIYSIEEDVYKNIWIGTAGGISIITDEGILNYETILDSYFIPICLFSDSRGWMWIGTTNGIYIFDQTDIYPVTFTNEDYNWIRCIMEDNNGRIWFGTNGGALYYIEDKGFYDLTVDDGLFSSVVSSILQDSWGDIWFAHLEAERITRWDGKNYEYLNLMSGYSYANIWSIVEDLNRNIWFTTNESGVIKYDGVIPETIGIKGGLKDYTIYCSMLDHEGNLWFGSKSQGVQVYITE